MLVYLGVEIDTVAETPVPEAKLLQLKGDIQFWLENQKQLNKNCSLLLKTVVGF